MCRWDLGNEFRGENSGIVSASPFGFAEAAIPGPLIRRGRRPEGGTFEFEMSKGPSKHGSNVVNRACVFQLGVKGGRRRSRGSERGSWAFLSQRKYKERNKFALELRRSRMPMWTHHAERLETCFDVFSRIQRCERQQSDTHRHVR